MNKKAVFFYGLFMDPDLLRDSGFDPSEPKVADLRGYKLIIGQRATLVKSEDVNAWGTIMSLSETELKELYSAPSVIDYKPMSVICHLEDGKTQTADVYILPEDYSSDKPNDSKYIDQLIEIGKKVGLPKNYISSLSMIAADIRNQ